MTTAANSEAPPKTLDKTKELPQLADQQHLLDSAQIKPGTFRPIGKVGDPPAFLSVPPNAWGSFDSAKKSASDPAVRPTAAEAPEGDAAKAQKANIDLLSNSKASSEDKLRAVDALYKSGTRDVTLGDGRHYSLQEQGLGSGHMVHLFSDGPDGKQHIVLRGIMGADGKSIEQETGKNGRHVNMEGDWWSRHMAGQTPFAAGNPDNFEFNNRRPLSFAPSDQPGAQDRPRPLAFKPEPNDENNPPRPLAFKPGQDDDPNKINFEPGKNPDGDASPLIRQQMAQRAYEYMQANPSTHSRTGMGNCSRIARQMYGDFGIKMEGMSGVHQGQYLESTGLFRRVPKEEAQPGDYVYRHWRKRPGDLGDSCIVTGRDRSGNVYAVSGAVKHPFAVNTHGGYYTPETYLRPTAKYEAYLKQHGLAS